jgi:bacteriocin-type transport-associated protein
MRKALFILGILNDNDLEWLLTTGRRETVAAGTTLVQEGRAVEAIYIVLEGAFGVTIGAKDEQEIARLLSGEIVGEISFVDARPPSATVKAVENSLVLSVPRRQLATKLEQDTAFAARFYQALAVFLADRLRSLTSRLGYGTTTALDEDTEYEDELAPNVLDNVSLAGARFDWMLRRLRGE